MLLQSRPLESKARREMEQCHTLTFAALRTGHHGLLASCFTFHGHCHGASCLAESRIFATAHSRASLPICISMLQRSSENLKVSKGIQGIPWGSKGIPLGIQGDPVGDPKRILLGIQGAGVSILSTKAHPPGHVPHRS